MQITPYIELIDDKINDMGQVSGSWGPILWMKCVISLPVKTEVVTNIS